MSYNPQVSADQKALRTGAITTSFDTDPLAIRGQNWNQAVWYFDVVLDSATDCRIQFDVAAPSRPPGPVIDVEPAAASTEWYPLAATESGTAATGILTIPVDVLELQFTVSGRYAYPMPINYPWIRARAKVTGVAGSATLGIKITTGLA